MQTENLFRTKMRQMRIVLMVLRCVESEPNLGCVLIKKKFLVLGIHFEKAAYDKNGSPKSGLGGAAGVPGNTYNGLKKRHYHQIERS